MSTDGNGSVLKGPVLHMMSELEEGAGHCEILASRPDVAAILRNSQHKRTQDQANQSPSMDCRGAPEAPPLPGVLSAVSGCRESASQFS